METTSSSALALGIRRPGAARQAQEPRRQLFKGSWFPVLFHNIRERSQPAPAKIFSAYSTHSERSFLSRRCTWGVDQNHRFSGLRLPTRFSGFPLPQLHGSRVFRAAPNSIPDRAVAARCTVCRPHGKAEMALRSNGSDPMSTPMDQNQWIKRPSTNDLETKTQRRVIDEQTSPGPRRSRPLYDLAIARRDRNGLRIHW